MAGFHSVGDIAVLLADILKSIKKFDVACRAKNLQVCIFLILPYYYEPILCVVRDVM